MPWGAIGALIAGSASSASTVKAPTNSFVSIRVMLCSLGLPRLACMLGVACSTARQNTHASEVGVDSHQFAMTFARAQFGDRATDTESPRKKWQCGTSALIADQEGAYVFAR